MLIRNGHVQVLQALRNAGHGIQFRFPGKGYAVSCSVVFLHRLLFFTHKLHGHRHKLFALVGNVPFQYHMIRIGEGHKLFAVHYHTRLASV